MQFYWRQKNNSCEFFINKEKQRRRLYQVPSLELFQQNAIFFKIDIIKYINDI